MFVEMSHALSPDIPVFPGLPHDEFVFLSRMNTGGESNNSIMRHPLHNGTHVDAPYHFYDAGRTIDQIPIDDFIFDKPLVIRKKLAKGGLLQVEDLEAAGPMLRTADILLLSTGYHAVRNDAAKYVDDFPALSVEAARMIRTGLLNVKAVAIDTLSIESCTQGPASDFVVHKTLLDGNAYATRPLLIFEDVNMGPILGKAISRIYAFPLRLVRLEASPVNMVAEVF
ncbi:MAG: cyclase family protein [Spirochaetia bacterium]|jgi:kynurenine formamidase